MLRHVRSTFWISASPQHLAGEQPVGRPPERVEADRAWEEVHAKVEPFARTQEILDLGVGLATRYARIKVTQYQFWRAQPEPAGEFAADDLRNESFRPLPRAAELHHIRAEVVGLHDGRQ